MGEIVVFGAMCCVGLLMVAIDQAPEALDAVTEWLERRRP